jgi:hypothetical protein
VDSDYTGNASAKAANKSLLGYCGDMTMSFPEVCCSVL